MLKLMEIFDEIRKKLLKYFFDVFNTEFDFPCQTI